MEPDRCLLLATGPEAPGARETLARALQEPPVAIMLSEEGLAWAEEDVLRAAHERGAARVWLCAVSARARNWQPTTAPDWIAWSGLAAWLLKHEQTPEIWAVTP